MHGLRTTFPPMPLDVPVDVSRLAPLPHHAVVRPLQAEEPQVWQCADSAQARQDYAQAVRSELLKPTCRVLGSVLEDADARSAADAPHG
jgi:hypothetical protein